MTVIYVLTQLSMLLLKKHMLRDRETNSHGLSLNNKGGLEALANEKFNRLFQLFGGNTHETSQTQ